MSLRLGVNIDHVATIRNARGGAHPDPVRAAWLVKEAGGDGITLHLREDRRHIVDEDLARLAADPPLPLNLEMALTDEMVAIALRHRPHAVCIVPEKREERTTESGLDVIGLGNRLAPQVRRLADAGIRVSLFVDADERQLAASAAAGAAVVELHTGTYAEHEPGSAAFGRELARLERGAATALALGLECHAGHGLTYGNVGPVAAMPEVVELNIGHFLIGEAVFRGFVPAIRHMRDLMDQARA
ncbi:MAG: pyridoxine 5'-phosphate synthase [Geminicoccaceae bacterium]|nr:MAG: pyridoxine 5'-phosphate synthase [Geminicoccaceae bacterium]